MCGFAGEFLLSRGRADLELATRMARRLTHRGPDEESSFLSADGRCAIAFRRLAVIDPAGSHQPMISEDGQVALAFNGEIYNFRELRQELVSQGVRFKTSGDCEVILRLYLLAGMGMLQRLTGMFSIIIHDGRCGKLFMARDRLGEKPLWYAVAAGRLVFGSEAKAVLAHHLVPQDVENESLLHFLTMGYVPAPMSIWRGIHKLPPGTWAEAGEFMGAPQTYWRPAIEVASEKPGDAVARVREQVTRAVAGRLAADVPLGALLSGGVDSTIVVGLMARAAGKAGGVRTFTAGFDDAGYDERPQAKLASEFFGTDHTELLVHADPKECLDRVVELYDEPFADSSALPTYLICNAARQHVTVALVGDGGDEVFGGYDRYRAIHAASTMGSGRYMAAKVAAALLGPLARHDERSRLRRFIRFAQTLSYPYAAQYFMYRRLFSPDDLSRLLTPEFAESLDLESPATWFCDLYEQPEMPDEVAQAQYHDLMTYLPDDLLVKTDIASMASSLELRAPLLDHDLVSLGLSLPADLKIHGRRGKAILREAFADMVPPGHFDRPKRGFAVPLDRWLREDLLETMKETLFDASFLDRKIISAEAMAGLVNDHLSGRGDHRHRLWALLVLARWFARSGQ